VKELEVRTRKLGHKTCITINRYLKALLRTGNVPEPGIYDFVISAYASLAFAIYRPFLSQARTR
jgi:hypothetical protein